MVQRGFISLSRTTTESGVGYQEGSTVRHVRDAAIACTLVAALGLSGVMALPAGAAGAHKASGGAATLKIGAAFALTGAVAPTAKQQEEGYDLYLRQHHSKLANVPTKMVYADDKGSATTTTIVTKSMISQDKVDMLGGGGLAPESIATLPIANANKMAYVTPLSATDDLTQRSGSPYFARVNMTSSQPNLYLGDYAYKQLHYHNVAMVIQDYAYGWESAGGFQYAFQKDGGKIAKKVYVPLTASDLTPYISQIPSNVDAVYAILVGGFAPRFETEYKQSGLETKVPLITGPDPIEENSLAAAGNNAIGVVGIQEYYSDM